MKETIDTIIQWHKETFPDATLEGQLEKYHEEVKEFVETDFKDLGELVDMFIVACGIARFDIHEGIFYFADIDVWISDNLFDWDKFEEAVNKKMEKNRKRVWVQSGKGNYHHENGIED